MNKRNYELTLNVTTGKIKIPSISIYNTDKGIFNIKLFLEKGEGKNIVKLTHDEMVNYKALFQAVKSKTKNYVELEGTLDETENFFYYDLGSKFNDQVGVYNCQIFITDTKGTNDSTTDDEVVTSVPFNYTVTASILTGLNAEITANPDLPVLQELINECKILMNLDSADMSVLDPFQKKEDDAINGTDKNIISNINSINSQIKDKASKNEVFTMANMGQDIKEAMTGGSVAVVGKGAILDENIVSNQLKGYKTDFLTQGEQLLDHSKYFYNDSRWNSTTHQPYYVSPTDSNAFITLPYIMINEFDVIRARTILSPNSLYCYDINLTYLGKGTFTQKVSSFPWKQVEFTLLENTKYIVIELKDSLANQIQFSSYFNLMWVYSLTFFNTLTDANSVDNTYKYNIDKTRLNIGMQGEGNVQQVSDWNNKTILTYGDSITAIGGGIGINLGWQKYVCDYFKFSTHYGMGIGGQSFRWNEKVWFANSDGTYNSRNDNLTFDNCQVGDIPSGCTKHRGAFCSWDRIKTMIPDSIKDTIDIIYVMGGTNDNLITTKYVWIDNATTDKDWANATENTLNGDYDVWTLQGAILSTIMKLQARCPNAVIVFGTPLSGRGTTGVVTTDLVGDEYEKAQIIKEVCSKFSIPVIDVFSSCGINPLNRLNFISDSVHPYLEEGKKMLARAVIGGLKTIIPNI